MWVAILQNSEIRSMKSCPDFHSKSTLYNQMKPGFSHLWPLARKKERVRITLPAFPYIRQNWKVLRFEQDESGKILNCIWIQSVFINTLKWVPFWSESQDASFPTGRVITLSSEPRNTTAMRLSLTNHLQKNNLHVQNLRGLFWHGSSFF